MRKIINGKAYDTETAKEVGSYSYLYRSDSHFFEETLYLKKTGEYFLYGEGGPLSRYAKREECGMWGSGWHISPFTEAEAREWAEENLTAEKYEALFGEVEE